MVSEAQSAVVNDNPVDCRAADRISRRLTEGLFYNSVMDSISIRHIGICKLDILYVVSFDTILHLRSYFTCKAIIFIFITLRETNKSDFF